MGKKVVAIVPAAGIGKRFGRAANKQFLALGGKPLIIWALEVLQGVDSVSEIIPVMKDSDMEQGFDLIERYNLTKIKKISPGGKERQDSVYKGLKLINDQTDAVLIHDGVRPLVDADLIKKALQELMSPPVPSLSKESGGGFDGVIVGVPPKDTIKEAANRGKDIAVKKTLKRNVLWAIQTPQVFKYASLMRAYKKAMADDFYSTDDSAIVEKYGGKVKIIAGSYTNIKITTPEDLDIAEMFLSKRRT